MGNEMKPLEIIDTDVLIDAGRDALDAMTCLKLPEDNTCPAVSVVTQMELMIGCRNKKESKALERFLARFQILTLSEPICDMAVILLRAYRLSHGILIPDPLIAATALHLGYPLVSKNQRDYRFIEGLHLLRYPNPSMG